MNAYQSAQHSAYGTTNTVRSDRGVEYDAFARITAAMKSASENFPALIRAIDENRRLWTIIATDVADENNGLPQDLRARIFYLAEYTLTQTVKIIRREATAESLIEINTMMMRGLRAQEV